jgi:hypothetical protein
MPNTPSFTTQAHTSFANSQEISPSKNGPSPGVKAEPHTPSRLEPAIFEGNRIFAAPNNGIHYYPDYDYSNYSTGQPLHDDRVESRITGSGMTSVRQNGDDQQTSTSEHHEAVTELDWLRYGESNKQ